MLKEQVVYTILNILFRMLGTKCRYCGEHTECRIEYKCIYDKLCIQKNIHASLQMISHRQRKPR